MPTPHHRDAIDRDAFLSFVGLAASLALSGCTPKNSSKTDGSAGSANLGSSELTPSDPSGNTSTADGDIPFSSADELTSLSDIQRNSIIMLNYLAVLMQEISESKKQQVAYRTNLLGLD